MRRCLIATASAAVAALWVAAWALDIPAEARSAPTVEHPSGKDGRPGGKAATQPKQDPRGGVFGPTGDDWRSKHSATPLTEEQEKEALEYLRKKRPEIYEQMVDQREKEPRRYRSDLRTIWSFVNRIRSLPEDVQQAHEVRQAMYVKMWRLARQYPTAPTAQAKADIEKQLREFAAQQFEADQVIRRHRLSQLADEIKGLEQELQNRARDRESLVRDIVERMKKAAERYGAERREGSKGGEQPATPPSSPDKKVPGRKTG